MTILELTKKSIERESKLASLELHIKAMNEATVTHLDCDGNVVEEDE